MEFTRDGYLELLRTIRGNGYSFTDFGQAEDLEGVVLLRHDVDFSLQAAVELSELEYREQVPLPTLSWSAQIFIISVPAAEGRPCGRSGTTADASDCILMSPNTGTDCLPGTVKTTAES